MSQVLLFTSPYFRGTITDTPSGQAYHVAPGQTVVADSEDVALLTGLGFTAAAPSATSGASLTLSDTNAHTITNTASIVVGSGGTLSGSGGVGTITGFGSGGGGAYLELESGTAASKISAMPTLANPPLAPFYLTGITNDGTTTANYQVPQGVIVQPNATDSTNANGILLQAGSAISGRGGSISIHSGSSQSGYPAGASVNISSANISQPGTSWPARSSFLSAKSGSATVTNAAGTGASGVAYLGAGGAYNSALSIHGAGAGATAFGATVAGSIVHGGNLSLSAGSAFGGTNYGGDIILQVGTGGTNGHVIINNLGTVDPHVLNAAWLGVSNGVTLSAG